MSSEAEQQSPLLIDEAASTSDVDPHAEPGQPDDAAGLTAAAIRLLSERSETVLNSIAGGVYCLDTEGRTIFVNEAGARIFGYSPREMLGRSQHELVHHHYADGSAFPVAECPIFASVTDGITQHVGSDVFWHKDGRPVPVDYTSIPLKDGRRTVGAVVTIRDISAEHRAEKQQALLDRERTAREELERSRAALEASEAESAAVQHQLESILEAAPWAISVTEGPDHVLRWANRVSRELMGSRAVIGLPAREIFPELVEQGFLEIIDTVYQTGESFSADNVEVLWDPAGSGEVRPGRFNIAYQALRGRDGGITGVTTHAIACGG